MAGVLSSSFAIHGSVVYELEVELITFNFILKKTDRRIVYLPDSWIKRERERDKEIKKWERKRETDRQRKHKNRSIENRGTCLTDKFL